MNANSNSGLNSNPISKGGAGSHEPLVDRALMALDLAAEHHLASCPCCQGEREKTEQALQQFAAFQREQASRPESFWEEQAARIRAARLSSRRSLSIAAVLAPAAMLLLVAAIFLVPRPQHVKEIQTQPAISDQELLVAVERAVESGTPDALQPVALGVEETETTSVVPGKRMDKEPTSHAN